MKKEMFKLPDGKEIPARSELLRSEIEGKLYPLDSLARLLITDDNQEEINRGAAGDVIQVVSQKVCDDIWNKFMEIERQLGRRVDLIYAAEWDHERDIKPGDLLDVRIVPSELKGNTPERKKDPTILFFWTAFKEKVAGRMTPRMKELIKLADEEFEKLGLTEQGKEDANDTH